MKTEINIIMKGKLQNQNYNDTVLVVYRMISSATNGQHTEDSAYNSNV